MTTLFTLSSIHSTKASEAGQIMHGQKQIASNILDSERRGFWRINRIIRLILQKPRLSQPKGI